MNRYVQYILNYYHHTPPKKPQLFTHKRTKISYGSSLQYATENESRPPLYSLGIKRFQGIFDILLYYAQAVYKNLIFTLSAIGPHQAYPTERTLAAITHLLEYATTFPNYGITYRASSMILAWHSDTSFLNESKAHNWQGPTYFSLKMFTSQPTTAHSSLLPKSSNWSCPPHKSWN